MRKLLWYLIAGTRGGVNRARIIAILHDRPYNANQISELLNLDYKTVTHHLKVLKKNYIIETEGNGYGQLHFLSELLEKNYEDFLLIWNKIANQEDGK